MIGTTLTFEMPDGSRWTVPSQVVIDDYASFLRMADNLTAEEADKRAKARIGRDREHFMQWLREQVMWSDLARHATETRPRSKRHMQACFENARVSVHRLRPAVLEAPPSPPRATPPSAPTKYPRLERVTSTHVATEVAAFYLNRAPQTLRKQACLGNAIIEPVRINRRLAWPVAELRRVLGVEAQQ